MFKTTQKNIKNNIKNPPKKIGTEITKNSNISSFSVANISFVVRDDTGFSFAIDSTMVWLPEIIFTFS